MTIKLLNIYVYLDFIEEDCVGNYLHFIYLTQYQYLFIFQ